MNVKDIMISPLNNKKVFIFGDDGSSFITNNCGDTFKPIKAYPNLKFILPNPANDSLIIGLLPIGCEDKDPECNPTSFSLMIS